MMNNKTLDDELNKVRARIREIEKDAEIARKELIYDIFSKYHEELMSYDPYKKCVSLAVENLNLQIQEANLVDEIGKNKENEHC